MIMLRHCPESTLPTPDYDKSMLLSSCASVNKREPRERGSALTCRSRYPYARSFGDALSLRRSTRMLCASSPRASGDRSGCDDGRARCNDATAALSSGNVETPFNRHQYVPAHDRSGRNKRVSSV